MQTPYLILSTLSIMLLMFLSPPCVSFATAARTPPPLPQDLLRSCCAQARYPTLCVQTLSSHVGPTTKPLDLAQAAVKVSLARAVNLSVYFKTLQSNLVVASTKMSNRQRVAVRDCVAQSTDSVAELKRTLNELRHLRMGTTFEWQMSNAQTWASTALTNGNSCISGINRSDAAGKVKLEVKRRVMDVAMLTSNALYMIIRLGDNTTPGN